MTDFRDFRFSRCAFSCAALLTSLTACGGGGEENQVINQAQGCHDGSWILSVVDIGPVTGCVDLGLDNAVIVLASVPTAAPPENAPESQVYRVSSNNIVVVDEAIEFSLGASYAEFEPGALNPDGPVQLMAITGRYYLPGADVTVTLQTGPTMEQFPTVEGSCDHFKTYVGYSVFAGEWFDEWPTGVATLLCSGDLEVNGARIAASTEPEPEEDLLLHALLELDGAAKPVELSGYADAKLRRGVLVSRRADGLRIEFEDSPQNGHVIFGELAAENRHGTLAGGLRKASQGLAGRVSLRDPNGSAARGTLQVRSVRR